MIRVESQMKVLAGYALGLGFLGGGTDPKDVED